MAALSKLGEYLKRNGLTQSEFAPEAGVPAPMVSVWSRLDGLRQRKPGLTNALAIERATNGEVPARYWDEVTRRLAG